MRSIFLGLALMAGPAAAQDWFTPEACAVTRSDLAGVTLNPGEAKDIALTAAGVVNGKGRLWKITTPEGAVSHLWGTYHTPDPLLLDLPQAFRDIVERARVVALEFDPVPDSPADAAADADAAWMWSTTGWTDWSFVPAEVRGWIDARLSAIGWGAGYIDQLTEAALASLLLSDPCGDYLSGVLPGQDAYIGQIAYLAGAEVTGLQKWRDFGAELGAPSRQEEARAVVLLYGAYLGPSNDLRAGRAASYRLYLEGRVAELDLWADVHLAEVLGDDAAARVSARAGAYLLVERNLTFVKAAMPLIRGGDAVIAVGASHLPGATGMVQLLRNEGLVVERIVLPGEVP